jgi:metal-dependent amidase/aminoacylase/carboxypeptidase family protein
VTSYYVYYRVEAGRVASLQQQIRQLFRSIEAATGVRGRWMRRRDAPTTYMEVYEDVRDERAFETLLEREAAKLGLERHVERFVCA